MADFEITRGAERPGVVYPITQGGTAVDLTGWQSIAFKARAVDGTALVINAAGSVLGTVTMGTVAYAFGTADTQQVGEYRARFEVVFATGELVTPEFTVRVVDAAPYRSSPGARDTMGWLIARVRDLLDDPAGPSQEFDDYEVQAALDRHRVDVLDAGIYPDAKRSTANFAVFKRYPLPGTEWESGTAFVVTDINGGTVTGYTLDPDRGVVNFAADQRGSAYFATGQVFDAHKSAADLCDRLIARYSREFDFATGRQTFNRSVRVKQLRDLANHLRSQGSLQTARIYRGDEAGIYRQKVVVHGQARDSEHRV
jgi:hypothetical protein